MSDMASNIYIYHGRVPNPHVYYGQNDLETAPFALVRPGFKWGDMQLSNGWDRTNYGSRLTSNAARYLVASVRRVPGQTRLSGTQRNNYPMRGMAPSQWDQYVQNGPGSQPQYPGGPGQIMGGLGYFGNSGG